jgi:16S rRNA processing protein RimM
MTRQVVVGRLSRVFGVRGELGCRPGAHGASVFEPGRSFTVKDGSTARTLRCRSVRRHHEKLLLGFEGIDTPEAAREFAGRDLHAELEAAPLGEDEYLDADLVGLRLLDEGGHDLGRVVIAVEHYPAQDCLLVEPGRRLVPLVRAFVRKIDIEAGTIVTALPAGLLD